MLEIGEQKPVAVNLQGRGIYFHVMYLTRKAKMNEMPSPILLIGDHYLCNKNILASKRKYKDYEWITMSATCNTVDEIRACATERTFLARPKIIIIKELPNKKAIREFLLELVSSSSSEVKFVIWDSDGAIKPDPKKMTFNKTWTDFITKFKSIKYSKVVDNGFGFGEKEDGGCVGFIINGFKKYKRSISKEVATVFMHIVGKERSYITSEIEKMCMSAPSQITLGYVQEFAYPSSKEAILYKFNNALDEKYSDAIVILDHFLGVDINANVLAEIIMKKARWQLAAAQLYSLGMGLEDIPKKLMLMGKFPSVAWHSSKLSYNQKKSGADSLVEPEKKQQFLIRKMGIPQHYFGDPKEKSRAEVIPMDFMAIQLVNTMSKNIIAPALKVADSARVRSLVFDKYMRNYLFVSDRLKEIRYGSNPVQELYEMIAVMTDRTLRDRDEEKSDAFVKLEK